MPVVGIALVGLTCASCGATATPQPAADPALRVDLARTRQAGTGPAFRPGPISNPAVAAGAQVGRLHCDRPAPSAYGAHIELFAEDRGIVVPAGIGVAPPWRRQGPFVLGGRCVYPLRTADPTGVVDVDPGAAHPIPAAGPHPTPTVGDLFALWGQPLSRRQLGAFRAPPSSAVVAFVDGRRWDRDPRAIPLSRHAQIVLELGPPVQPHPAYLFPRGL